MTWKPALGARYLGGGRCRFGVWAPLAQRVDLHLLRPRDCLVPMEPRPRGYFEVRAEAVGPGARYLLRLDGASERPDPASSFQPGGVHGPSEVVDPAFAWSDAGWAGPPLPRYVLYELHVGTFTTEGTFDAVIPHLDELAELGVTVIEIMPVAQFPGRRNWGYDGVYPYAVQDSYGGPAGLKRLVDASHRRGLGVCLDVVYNHAGPEGSHLGEFGPYFSQRYKTPWGPALNFDGPHSDEVRRHFIENALYWIVEFHVDALRLDAVHAILDRTPRTFLEELAATVQTEAGRLGRRVHLIAESSDDDARLVRPQALGGHGMDAQWNDDFHHALRVSLTGDRTGYYQDYEPLTHLAKAYRQGYAYTGQYSRFRRRTHGSPCADIPPERFVVFIQNHDQVGNRLRGDRLGEAVSFEALKVAAALPLLSPYIPLLFMGEEYADPAPFPYFTSHGDPALVEAVRRGRKDEFASFAWGGEPPDPQDEATFASARLNHALKHRGDHQALLAWYRELLRLRRELPALALLSKEHMEVTPHRRERVLAVRRWTDGQETLGIYHLGDGPASLTLDAPCGEWDRVVDSQDVRWLGPGVSSPQTMTSDGGAKLDLRGYVALLYVLRGEP